METAEVATQTVSERIAQDVAQFDPAAAKIERFNDYLTLRVNGPDDKDGIKMVGEARLEVKRERTGLERLRKQFVEDAVAYQNGINKKAREYREAMEKIEAHLESEEGKVEQWKKEAAEAEAKAALARIEDRKRALFTIGLTWNGRDFSHILPGVPSVSEAELNGLEDGPYSELLDRVSDAVSTAKAEAQRQKEALAEQQRKDHEERKKQEAIAAENARRAKELSDKEDALNANIAMARANELLALGALRTEFPSRELHTYSAEGWPDIVREVRDTVDRNRARAKEEQERINREQEAAAAKAEADRLANEQRIAAQAAQRERELIAKEEADRKEAEAERIRKAGDVGAIQQCAEDVRVQLDIAQKYAAGLKSGVAKHGLTLAVKHMNDALSVLNGTLTDLQ